MININYLPNFQIDDLFLNYQQFLNIFGYKKGLWEERLEKLLREFFCPESVALTASGREALLLILKALGIGRQDEVIIQAFTCAVVANPIISLGAKPIYVDIGEDYNLDTADLLKKISSKTRVIIVQHTFGIPADIIKLQKIAKDKNIILIEDLAHAFGQQFEGRKLGTYGDFSFLSFGRTKALSSVFGGAAVLNNIKFKNQFLSQKNNMVYPEVSWVLKVLLYQPIFYNLSFVYDFFSLGKAILFILSKLKIIIKEVENQEKKGLMVFKNCRKMPNSLCRLAYNQVVKLDKYLMIRQIISRIYQENLNPKKFTFPSKPRPYLRFPVRVKNKERIFTLAKKRKFYLGDWYSSPVGPKDVLTDKVLYENGSCPRAEKRCQEIINLPTNPSLREKDIYGLTAFLNKNGF